MSGRAVPPAESRIEIACRNGVWIVTLHGEHDISTQPSLQEQLERVAEAGGRIVVDLSPASFLDSSVIRALAGPRDGDGARLHALAVVAPPGSFARRLADLVDLDAVVAVHASLPDALRGGSRR